jgi:putative transposase
MDRQALRRDFYPFVYRRLQRTGVQFGRSRYWSPALAPMIEPAQVVRVHYHPGNPTCVWVSAGDNVLIEAKVVAGVALGEASRLKFKMS